MYTKDENLRPLPPELEYIDNVDVNAYRQTAMNIVIDDATLQEVFKKLSSKKSNSPGLNQINYLLLKQVYLINPE